MLSIGQVIQLEITSIASTGFGRGVFEDETPLSVFVPYSVVGDVLEVEITEKKKVYFQARIKKIISPSKDRQTPVCQHFMKCGACDWLHMTYDAQLRAKESLLRFFAKKVAIDLSSLTVLPSPQPLHYRDKVRVTNGGFYQRQSHTIEPISSCSLIHPALNKQVFPTSSSGVFAYDYADNKVSSSWASYDLDGLKLLHHVNGFVQSNTLLNQELVRLVCSKVVGDTVLDLYCGNGNFTLPLAKQGCAVTAVEGDKVGFSLLCANLKNNDLHATVLHQDVKALSLDTSSFDTVILDPPRAGCDGVLSSLSSSRVIYVSCNPQVALKEIRDSPYILKETFLVDLFPQTRHLEAVFILELKKE